MQRTSAYRPHFLVFLAVVGLALLHPASVAIGGGQGRDNSQCVQACNVIRDGCRMSCEVDCSVFGMPGDPAYDACYYSCDKDCLTEMQECKKLCNVNHNPPSPTEP